MSSARGSPPGAQWERIYLPMQEMLVRSLGQKDPLEKEMATRSSILAWEIPWTEEPGGLQCMGLQRIWHPEQLSTPAREVLRTGSPVQPFLNPVELTLLSLPLMLLLPEVCKAVVKSSHLGPRYLGSFHWHNFGQVSFHALTCKMVIIIIEEKLLIIAWYRFYCASFIMVFVPSREWTSL